MAKIREIDPVNQRVRQVRQTLELSQSKFAQVIAISKGYIADVEIGVRKVNERLIKLIASSFNVNEVYLKEGTGEMFSENPKESFTKLIALFKELEPKYQEFILKQIDLLLDMQGE